MSTAPRDRLLRLLATRAYAFDPNRGFHLASGETSSEYIDCKSALTFPEALEAAAALMWPLLRPEAQAVGGLTMGADPLAVSLSLYAHARQRPLRWFTVRKGAKTHGLQRLIEGNLPEASQVAILEDVVTRGTSTMDAIDKCEEAGHRIVQVLALVDREQGGMQRVRDHFGPSVPVEAIFRKSEIHAEWQRVQQSPPASRAIL